MPGSVLRLRLLFRRRGCETAKRTTPLVDTIVGPNLYTYILYYTRICTWRMYLYAETCKKTNFNYCAFASRLESTRTYWYTHKTDGICQ